MAPRTVEVQAAWRRSSTPTAKAHAAGVSLRTLADLTGLISSRIHQIVSPRHER